jgi:bifunctional NMN adenylyltransferase/nudix hydrolase
MNIIEKQYDVGVMVCRFQVPDLSEAHKKLIETVRSKHPRTIIFLGLSPVLVTRNNPLDFEARKQMILSQYPDVTVLYIKDQPLDDLWSNNLDTQIKDVCPNQAVVLYGGRDSFLKAYTGKYPVREFQQTTFISGTQLREEAAKRSKTTADFRAGVIHAAHKQYPKNYATVDVAIYDSGLKRVLVGRKANEEKYRFIGGFTEPKNDSNEADAVREVQEEAGLIFKETELQYICSTKIDDWRYRSEVDKIRTTFYLALYEPNNGTPVAGDDIAEVRWMTIGEINPARFVYEHHVLIRKLDEFLFENNFFTT